MTDDDDSSHFFSAVQAKALRDKARTATQAIHGWLGRKWIEIKSVFGFHG